MRKFIILILAIVCAGQLSASDKQSEKVFYNTVIKARRSAWTQLSTAEMTGNIAHLWIGKPYKAKTLEGEGPERVRIDLTGFDCVTLYESALGMARVIKTHGFGIDALERQIELTRYRGGRLDGYLSRLHYTSDWIYDNIQKGVVEDLTRRLGGVDFDPAVAFMSEHPQYYPPLKSDSAMIGPLREIEQKINSRQYYYIPKGDIASIADSLHTGDIVAITTNIEGLDYAHTGLVWVDESGRRRLLHASSDKKKVVLDKPIDEYMAGKKKFTGITVVRPLEPEK
jgi:hypothetical protein